MNEWISVKDRLPEGRNVLVTNNINALDAHGDMSHIWIGFVTHAIDGTYVSFDDGDNEVFNITHWMFLPNPNKD